MKWILADIKPYIKSDINPKDGYLNPNSSPYSGLFGHKERITLGQIISEINPERPEVQITFKNGQVTMRRVVGDFLSTGRKLYVEVPREGGSELDKKLWRDVISAINQAQPDVQRDK